MILNLLLVVVLAAMAHQSKRFVLSGILYGILKSIGSFYYYANTTTLPSSQIIVVAFIQLVLNCALGIAIGYLVAKHSKNAKLAVVTTVLAAATFITQVFDTPFVT